MNHINTILHTLCICLIRKYSSYLVHMLILKTSHRMCEKITHKIIFLCKIWRCPTFIFQSCAFLSHKLEILHQWERAATRLSYFVSLKRSCVSVYRCIVFVMYVYCFASSCDSYYSIYYIIEEKLSSSVASHIFVSVVAVIQNPL